MSAQGGFVTWLSIQTLLTVVVKAQDGSEEGVTG